MRKVISIVLFSLLLLTSTSIFAAAPTPANLFPTEQSAQQHCPNDTVVWLNLPTGVYHYEGQRWYGNTKNGAYVCEQEADQAGDRATKNGQ